MIMREPLSREVLLRICDNGISEDSYIISPTYYLMTGRKGGWVYKVDHRYVVCVVHPNLPKRLLVFHAVSPVKNTNIEAEIQVAEMLRQSHSDYEVQLSRIPQALAAAYSENIIEEETLDWKYPEHYLSVQAVCKMAGKSFQQIRQRLNHLDLSRCSDCSINPAADSEIIHSVAENWASAFPYHNYTREDLLSPTDTLLSFMLFPDMNLHGHIIYYDGVPSAFCIWEERNGVANIYNMAAVRVAPGLAEYNISLLCRRLSGSGVSELNLGGSESEGLDRFKRKFAPHRSLSLCSMKLF